jgi:hypothetical protein
MFMPKKIDPEGQGAVRAAGAGASDGVPVVDGCGRGRGPRRGVGKESVRRWVIQAQVDGGTAPGCHERGVGRDQEAQGQGPAARGGQRDPAPGLDFLRGGTRPPQPLIVAFIDDARRGPRGRVDLPGPARAGLPDRRADLPGLERTGRPVAAGRSATRWSRTQVRDLAWTVDHNGRRQLTPEGLYGRRKMTALVRRGLPQASPGSVDRAMRSLGLQGIRAAKGIRTTIPAKDGRGPGTCSTATSPPPPRTRPG